MGFLGVRGRCPEPSSAKVQVSPDGLSHCPFWGVLSQRLGQTDILTPCYKHRVGQARWGGRGGTAQNPSPTSSSSLSRCEKPEGVSAFFVQMCTTLGGGVPSLPPPETSLSEECLLSARGQNSRGPSPVLELGGGVGTGEGKLLFSEISVLGVFDHLRVPSKWMGEVPRRTAISLSTKEARANLRANFMSK